MEEALKYIVGIDIGTDNVRGVIATLQNDSVIVMGYAEEPNTGMRKGEIVSVNGVWQVVDLVLDKMEKMSGVKIYSAVVSINGAQLQSDRTQGMIVMGDRTHKISELDLKRIRETALAGQELINREILEVVPFEYIVDGQGGVLEPLGMNGARLELKANVVSSMESSVINIKKVVEEMAQVSVQKVVPTAIASANAVLTERQMENGVAVIDFGATTTSVAIYDEGSLQNLFVVPMGALMITKDLASVLKIDMEMAEEIKRNYTQSKYLGAEGSVRFKFNGENLEIGREVIEENIRARLVDIFEKVREGLVQAGYGWKLPEGVVLVGGGAKTYGLSEVVREVLGVAVKIGKPRGLSGVHESVERTEYATAVGLMLMANEEYDNNSKPIEGEKVGGFLSKLFGKF